MNNQIIFDSIFYLGGIAMIVFFIVCFSLPREASRLEESSILSLVNSDELTLVSNFPNHTSDFGIVASLIIGIWFFCLGLSQGIPFSETFHARTFVLFFIALGLVILLFSIILLILRFSPNSTCLTLNEKGITIQNYLLFRTYYSWNEIDYVSMRTISLGRYSYDTFCFLELNKPASLLDKLFYFLRLYENEWINFKLHMLPCYEYNGLDLDTIRKILVEYQKSSLDHNYKESFQETEKD